MPNHTSLSLVERFSVRGGASKSPKSVDHGAVHKIARFHPHTKIFHFRIFSFFDTSPLSVLAQLQNPVQADTERAPALRLTSTGRRLCLASNLPFPRPRPVLRPQAARPLVRMRMRGFLQSHRGASPLSTMRTYSLELSGQHTFYTFCKRDFSAPRTS